MYVYMYMCIYIHIYVYVCVYICIYTHDITLNYSLLQYCIPFHSYLLQHYYNIIFITTYFIVSLHIIIFHCIITTLLQYYIHYYILNYTLLQDLTCTKLCKTLIQNGVCNDHSCKYAHTKEERWGRGNKQN